MNFYTHHTSLPDKHYASYSCQSYTRAESKDKGGEEPLCYDLDRAPSGQRLCRSGDIRTGGPWRVQPQDDCGGSEVMPLDSNLAAVRSTIRGLRGRGSATYSSSGIAWGIRLLDPSWRDVWGHAEHPMDVDTGVQKVMVLLTDGEDNHFPDAFTHRRLGCTAAKSQGIVIFTIAAMHSDYVGSTLADELAKCSSRDDDPSGTYVFVNNSTPEDLKNVFSKIARQMIRLRRTY